MHTSRHKGCRLVRKGRAGCSPQRHTRLGSQKVEEAGSIPQRQKGCRLERKETHDTNTEGLTSRPREGSDAYHKGIRVVNPHTREGARRHATKAQGV